MRKKNLYHGRRVLTQDTIVEVNDEVLLLSPSLRYRNHSPTGFNWGYGGSGPAQLAFAILLNEFGRSVAESCYQEFKWDVISLLPDVWTLSSDQIDNWVDSWGRRK